MLEKIWKLFYMFQMNPKKPISRMLSLFFVIILAFTCTGIMYGWPAILLVYKHEGQFIHRCKAEIAPPDTCEEQELGLNLIYTISVSCLVAAQLPAGFVLDWIGPRRSIAIGWLTLTISFILLSFSDARTPSGFNAFIPGYVIMSVSGMFIYFSLFRLSEAYGKWNKVVLVLIVCAFDASAGLFLGYWYVYEAIGIESVIFFKYLIIMPAVGMLFTFFWPTGAKGDPQSGPAEEPFAGLQNNTSDGREEKFTITDTLIQKRKFSVHSDLSFYKQLFTLEYIFFIFYFASGTLWMNFFFGTIEARLNDFLEVDRTEFLVKVFSATVPAAFIVAPLISYLSKYSHVFNFAIVHFMGLLASFLIFIKIDELWFFLFIVFSIHRMWFYSVCTMYLVKIFGYANIGKLYGLAGFIAGVVNLIQYLFLYIIVEKHSGSFLTMNYVQLGFYLVMTLLPIHLMCPWHSRLFK